MSSLAAKKAETTAQLAAKEAELKALQEEGDERARLEQRIRTLDVQREVKVAQAKVNAYNQELENLTANESNQVPVSIDPKPSSPTPVRASAALNPDAPAYCCTQQPISLDTVNVQPSAEQNYSTLAQVLQSSMLIGRLPLPEAMIFNGDPLQYTEWKASFITLVDNKSISAQEKFYYLKKYGGKEAGKAIQGFFLAHTEASYQAAWATLEDCYGNPFLLQRAFREKLNNWPVISPKNAEGLREYADFLQGCQKAMTQIPSLEVLNDCMENRKLLSKLPNWASTRWNRKVTKQLEETGQYPNFSSFVAFVVAEAKVACNPVSSFGGLSEEKKPDREPNRNKASVLTTNTNLESEGKGETRENKQTVKKCPFCKSLGHYLPNCPTFTQSSLKERRKFIQEQKRCYGCLRVGHDSKNCKQKHTCQTCKRKHPTCLHNDNVVPKQENEGPSDANVHANPSAATLRTNNKRETHATSTTVPVWISTKSNPHHERLAYAILDNQSNTTFVTEEVCGALHPESEAIKLKLTTITERESNISCQRISGLQVRGYTSNVIIDIPSAYTRELIPADPTQIPTNETAKNWNHLRSIANEIPPLLDCDVGLLIGYNCSQALVPQEVITGNDDEPFAVRMDLGWSIVGRASPSASCLNIIGICHRASAKECPLITPSDALRVLEKDFQDIENDTKAISQEDLFFLNIMEKGITRTTGGHCDQMPLPFRRAPSLPNNREAAATRLSQLKRKLERNATYQREYTQYMQEMLDLGHAEKAPNAEDGPKWYIPHHGVYHPRKKKLRVVFDCSARFGGTSLNDQLLVGPDFINNLFGVLCRFRQHPVAIMCDIEKMFHQFHVSEEHHNFLHFLWWENGNLTLQPVEYRMKVHLFGATSSPGCANYGLKHLARESKESVPLGSDFVERNFYVDDGLTSVPTEKHAIQIIKEARALCSTGQLSVEEIREG